MPFFLILDLPTEIVVKSFKQNWVSEVVKVCLNEVPYLCVRDIVKYEYGRFSEQSVLLFLIRILGVWPTGILESSVQSTVLPWSNGSNVCLICKTLSGAPCSVSFFLSGIDSGEAISDCISDGLGSSWLITSTTRSTTRWWTFSKKEWPLICLLGHNHFSELSFCWGLLPSSIL